MGPKDVAWLYQDSAQQHIIRFKSESDLEGGPFG